jgi:hypothetical protein
LSFVMVNSSPASRRGTHAPGAPAPAKNDQTSDLA